MILEQSSTIKFHENRSNGNRVIPRAQTEMTKLTAKFLTRLKTHSTFYSHEHDICILSKTYPLQ